MRTIKTTIPGYGGGIANSPYAPLREQSFQTAKNLDVFSQQRVLRPIVNIESQTTDPAMSSAKIRMVFKPSSGNVTYFWGNNGSNKTKIWNGGFNSATLTLLELDGGSAVSSQNINAGLEPTSFDSKNWVAELNGYLLFWDGASLSNILLSSETYTEDFYTFTAGTIKGPIMTHEGQQKAFIAVDNKVYFLTSTTVSSSGTDPVLALTLGSKYIIRSMAPYGRYIAIGAQDLTDASNSKVFIWDGSSTTVEDILDIGDIGLQSIRNVNGILHILCTRIVAGSPNNYCRVYLVNGNKIELGDELVIDSSAANYATASALAPIDDATVIVSGDKLLWTFKGYWNNYSNYLNITNGIYAYGKFETGQPRVLTLLATTENSATNMTFTCLKETSNQFSVCFSSATNYYLESQECNATTGTKSANGVYESVIFPLDGESGAFRGKIKSIEIQHEPMPASCGFTVSVKHYGSYEPGGTVSSDSYTDLTTPLGSGSSTGKTQSTTNSTYTIIENNNSFKKATHAQIKISFDEVSGTNAPAIIFPSIVITSIIENA